LRLFGALEVKNWMMWLWALLCLSVCLFVLTLTSPEHLKSLTWNFTMGSFNEICSHFPILAELRKQ
jgi:hypothetical protein